MDLFTLAIPFFLVAIGIEVVYSHVRRLPNYRLNDSINNLACGISDHVIAIFTKSILFAGYLGVYKHLSTWKVPSNEWWAWVGLWFGADFFYYWFHRFSHRVNVAWAAHSVHHQSEEYNLSVALRQSTFQSAFSWVFYLPLAWIGFSPEMFLTVSSLNTLYQFWIHTQAIGRMGPLEWIFNTPSHHRVHHGRNAKYIDKNYAGSLIIWDRFFGTFQPEEEKAVFGVTSQLKSWNPVWANFVVWIGLARQAFRSRSALEKFQVWFMPPGWTQEGTPLLNAAAAPAYFEKYDAQLARRGNIYVFTQFIVVLLAIVLLSFGQHSLMSAQVVMLSAFIVVSLVALGALFERKRWAMPVEIFRLLGLLALVLWSF